MVVGSLTYFDLVFVLTAGGPGYATRLLPLHMYLTGFQANEMGAASAIGVLLVLLGLGLALVVQRLGGRDRAASEMEGA
jgi:raffinose/stachyose/melibiose transport system permease protein